MSDQSISKSEARIVKNLLSVIKDNKFSDNIDDFYSKINLNQDDTSISNDLKLLKFDLKKKFVNRFEEAVLDLKDAINTESLIFDDIIKLERRYNRINSHFVAGLISFSDSDLEFTKIENTFIFIVNNLDSIDLK